MGVRETQRYHFGLGAIEIAMRCNTQEGSGTYETRALKRDL